MSAETRRQKTERAHVTKWEKESKAIRLTKPLVPHPSPNSVAPKIRRASIAALVGNLHRGAASARSGKSESGVLVLRSSERLDCILTRGKTIRK